MVLEDDERRRLEAELLLERGLLADTQRLARVGAWRREIGHDKAHWSDEVYRLLRRDPALGPYSHAERQRGTHILSGSDADQSATRAMCRAA